MSQLTHGCVTDNAAQPDARRDSPSMANTPLPVKVREVTMLSKHVRET